LFTLLHPFQDLLMYVIRRVAASDAQYKAATNPTVALRRPA